MKKSVPFLSEASFHDEWALRTPIEQILVTQSFESITAQENRFILKLIDKYSGSLKGKRVLDLGSGLGESAVYFALQGAYVTAVDVSPQMINRCLKVAEHYGVRDRITGIAAPVGCVQLLDNYDIAFAANLFHHIENLEGLVLKVKSCLRPGGMMLSWDPIAYNPLINVYRKIASSVRTKDEHPLRISDLRKIKKIFPGMRHREFWLCTLVLFFKYFLIDRKDPNACRYWKQILNETDSSIGRWFRPLLALDDIVCRVPGIKWLGWNTVVWAVK